MQSIHEKLPERLIKRALKSNQELVSVIKKAISTATARLPTRRCRRRRRVSSHLHHGRVDLEDLLLAFDLSHADLAGQLGGGGVAVALQREGTLQGTLVTGPHLRKGELLQRRRRR